MSSVCGRYATTRHPADLSALFDALDDTGESPPPPDYNVAPTDPVPIVRVSQRLGGRAVSAARWGLVPSWAQDMAGAARMINARAETVATARAYAPSFGRRRCLVPADGWYEWVPGRGGGRKQPYFMTPRDGGVLAFAGLWSPWGPRPVFTCTIVTMPALGDLALVHNRMPLVLPPERWAAWLAGPADPALLAPPPEEFLANLELRPVGPAVGDVRNDGPELTRAVPAPPLGVPYEDCVNLTLF